VFHPRPLTFNIFINDICESIHNSQCLLFADDLKIYHSISDVDDCKLLQRDIDSVQNWCLNNGMKLSSSKTTIMYFTRKTNILILIPTYATIRWYAPSVLKISVFYWTASFIFTSTLTTRVSQMKTVKLR
jgi:hypothetical protein